MGNLNQYELMWILGTDEEEDFTTKLNNNLTQIIEKAGGSVSVLEMYGRRTLAHTIQGQKEGDYFLSRFFIDSSKISQVENEIKRENKIIRHLVTRVTSEKPLISPNKMDEVPDTRNRRGR